MEHYNEGLTKSHQQKYTYLFLSDRIEYLLTRQFLSPTRKEAVLVMLQHLCPHQVMRPLFSRLHTYFSGGWLTLTDSTSLQLVFSLNYSTRKGQKNLKAIKDADRSTAILYRKFLWPGPLLKPDFFSHC